MQLRVLVPVFAAFLALGSAAFGQNPRVAPQDGTAANGPSQTFTFGDELVQSQLPRPDGPTVRGRGHPDRITLIRHRSHFVQEMFKSVENL